MQAGYSSFFLLNSVKLLFVLGLDHSSSSMETKSFVITALSLSNILNHQGFQTPILKHFRGIL